MSDVILIVDGVHQRACSALFVDGLDWPNVCDVASIHLLEKIETTYMALRPMCLINGAESSTIMGAEKSKVHGSDTHVRELTIARISQKDNQCEVGVNKT
ncbi:hypothetical protein V6N12_007268 [Hibiscus sabdariffa]|uniref:Uncharacterized protein n=1 Tax=Hibiscus sabdariffa TaxID=183260 RepID=A0ABR2F195_9ROSI